MAHRLASAMHQLRPRGRSFMPPTSLAGLGKPPYSMEIIYFYPYHSTMNSIRPRTPSHNSNHHDLEDL